MLNALETFQVRDNTLTSGSKYLQVILFKRQEIFVPFIVYFFNYLPLYYFFNNLLSMKYCRMLFEYL